MYTVQCTHVCYSTLSELSKNIPDYRYFVIVNIVWISRVEGKPFFWANKKIWWGRVIMWCCRAKRAMMPAYKTYYEERAKALDSIIEKFRSVQSSNVVDTDKLIRILNCGPICYVINLRYWIETQLQLISMFKLWKEIAALTLKRHQLLIGIISKQLFV